MQFWILLYTRIQRIDPDSFPNKIMEFRKETTSIDKAPGKHLDTYSNCMHNWPSECLKLVNTSAISIAQVWKTPHISDTNCITHTRQNKFSFRIPTATFFAAQLFLVDHNCFNHFVTKVTIPSNTQKDASYSSWCGISSCNTKIKKTKFVNPNINFEALLSSNS